MGMGLSPISTARDLTQYDNFSMSWDLRSSAILLFQELLFLETDKVYGYYMLKQSTRKNNHNGIGPKMMIFIILYSFFPFLKNVTKGNELTLLETSNSSPFER